MLSDFGGRAAWGGVRYSEGKQTALGPRPVPPVRPSEGSLGRSAGGRWQVAGRAGAPPFSRFSTVPLDPDEAANCRTTGQKSIGHQSKGRDTEAAQVHCGSA